MKQMFKIITIACLISIFTSCGGGGGGSKIEGPTLSLGEALSIIVDQFYINSGLDDEYGSRGEFSVYLRDAATGQDVACTKAEDGMEELSTAGIYYGGLSIPLTEVDEEHPDEMARFQLVFVEQDGEGCPGPIDDDDDIAGISTEFMFDSLIDKKIWATNGQAVAVLRNQSSDVTTVSPMAPALEEGLIIDEIYFNNGSDGQSSSRYYIFVDQIESGSSTYQCQVDDDLMADVRFGDIVYSALGFPISCFSANDPDFDFIKVRLGLYIQKSQGPVLVGETEATAIGDMIGENVPFTNGKGYVTFRNIITTPFASSALRLGELASVEVTSMSYELTPSFNPTIELHIMNGSGDYIIACAGEDQGLTGVDAPGEYDDLSATFVAATGQRELFGWDDVIVKLVDRTDGYSCPKPLEGDPTTLAQSGSLSGSDLLAGTIDFLNGAGTLSIEAPTSDNN
ncbi:MAG: hypothetical protein HN337_08360 [Deltaproteobacteria bacterium]|jgi:hypothetical protein|nr:hypothetical protein [Deltaproteobacteria bacterium]